MRILANENFPREAVEAHQARGHDVFWARTDSPGAPDCLPVDRAASENRLLITFDKDFGELAFRRGLYSPAGIILSRIRTPSPGHVAQVAGAVVEARSDWAGHFSVIEEGRVRMTPLPPSPAEQP
jgi:predicted nuclease of predicted toxin-antitoxin system